jgi:hypothetical protein
MLSDTGIQVDGVNMSKNVRNITISTGTPTTSTLAVGDVWLKYTE